MAYCQKLYSIQYRNKIPIQPLNKRDGDDSINNRHQININTSDHH